MIPRSADSPKEPTATHHASPRTRAAPRYAHERTSGTREPARKQPFRRRSRPHRQGLGGNGAACMPLLGPPGSASERRDIGVAGPAHGITRPGRRRCRARARASRRWWPGGGRACHAHPRGRPLARRSGRPGATRRGGARPRGRSCPAVRAGGATGRAPFRGPARWRRRRSPGGRPPAPASGRRRRAASGRRKASRRGCRRWSPAPPGGPRCRVPASRRGSRPTPPRGRRAGRAARSAGACR